MAAAGPDESDPYSDPESEVDPDPDRENLQLKTRLDSLDKNESPHNLWLVAKEDPAKGLHAPMPFDVYISLLTPPRKFANASIHAVRQREGKRQPDGFFLINILERYQDDIGLEDVRDTEIKLGRWQSNSFQELGIFNMNLHVPPLTDAIVVYRGFAQGITGDQPTPGTDFQMRSANSFSFSFGFVSKMFTTSDPRSLTVRADILPGVRVLLANEYFHANIITEYEVIVPGTGVRVHVFPADRVLEGQRNMDPPPVVYGYKSDSTSRSYHDGPLKKISFYFIVSMPGQTIENYQCMYPTERRGGGRYLRGGTGINISDDNALAIGNVGKIMNSFIRVAMTHRGTLDQAILDYQGIRKMQMHNRALRLKMLQRSKKRVEKQFGPRFRTPHTFKKGPLFEKPPSEKRPRFLTPHTFKSPQKSYVQSFKKALQRARE